MNGQSPPLRVVRLAVPPATGVAAVVAERDEGVGEGGEKEKLRFPSVEEGLASGDWI